MLRRLGRLRSLILGSSELELHRSRRTSCLSSSVASSDGASTSIAEGPCCQLLHLWPCHTLCSACATESCADNDTNSPMRSLWPATLLLAWEYGCWSCTSWVLALDSNPHFAHFHVTEWICGGRVPWAYEANEPNMRKMRRRVRVLRIK